MPSNIIQGLARIAKGFASKLTHKAFWLALAKDVGLISALLLAISFYQQQDMIKGQAPELAAQTISGDMVNLDSNTPKLIYFWGSWCPYCRFTSPMVNSLINDYQVITIARDSGNNAQINQYLKAHELQFDVVQDKVQTSSIQHQLNEAQALSDQWGVTTYPSIFILDSDNQIRFVSTGVTSNWGLRLRLWLASW